MKKTFLLLFIGLFLFIWNINPIQKKQNEKIITSNYKSFIGMESLDYYISNFNDYPQDNLIISNDITHSEDILFPIQYKENAEQIKSISQVINNMIYMCNLKTIGLDYQRSNSYFNISLFNNVTKLGRT